MIPKIYILQILKPAFTILRDENSKCFLLLIRGTHSIKDTLTAATGAVVPFHHSVLTDGGISNLVLGYAHCGMVAAARWIAKLSTPFLLKALEQNPNYKVKVEVDHIRVSYSSYYYFLFLFIFSFIFPLLGGGGRSRVSVFVYILFLVSQLNYYCQIMECASGQHHLRSKELWCKIIYL